MKKTFICSLALFCFSIGAQENPCNVDLKKVLNKYGGRSQICEGKILLEDGREITAVFAVSIPANQQFIRNNPARLERQDLKVKVAIEKLMNPESKWIGDAEKELAKPIRYVIVDDESLNPNIAFCISGDGKNRYSANFNPGEWETNPKSPFGYSLKIHDPITNQMFFEVEYDKGIAYDNSYSNSQIKIPLRCH